MNLTQNALSRLVFTPAHMSGPRDISTRTLTSRQTSCRVILHTNKSNLSGRGGSCGNSVHSLWALESRAGEEEGRCDHQIWGSGTSDGGEEIGVEEFLRRI